MKQVWVLLENWSEELVTAAIESGVDALVLPPGHAAKAKVLGRITVVSADGDLKPEEDVFFEPLQSPEDERRIGDRLRSGGTVVVRPSEGGAESLPVKKAWEVIPIENLLALGCGVLYVPVESVGDMEVAFGILERGVAGVVMRPEDPAVLRSMVGLAKKSAGREVLKTARIEAVSHAGMGDRVCVDTCTSMVSGQGMLVGNSSGFLFLVRAETDLNPYVAPRPFRVNAGAVHSYARVPGGATCYLSELAAGRKVLIFGPEGCAEEATVGRVKVERRPLLLIEATCGGRRGTLIVQNAETIRLSDPDGEPISVARLAPGDSVLVATESAGRHFGMKIEETIREE